MQKKKITHFLTDSGSTGVSYQDQAINTLVPSIMLVIIIFNVPEPYNQINILRTAFVYENNQNFVSHWELPLS